MRTPALLCATAEIALNRVLRLEPAVEAQCAELDGRRIAFDLEDLGWRLLLTFVSGGVRVSDGVEETADVTARAPSARFLSAALRTAGGGGGLPHDLSVEGDTELLQRFARLLASVGFDAEELLAPTLGDDLAHRLTSAARDLLGWGRRSGETLARGGAAYLRDDGATLADAAAVSRWGEDVEKLRDGVERLQARIERLESRRDAGDSP